MPLCSIKLILPGMTLGAEVVGPGGQVLAGAGTRLLAKHIEAFRTWGISTVSIEEAVAPAVAIDPLQLLAIKRRVAQRFTGQPVQHPAVQELYRMAVERELIAMAKR